MMTLKVHGNEYRIRFTYKTVFKTHVLKDVINMQESMKSKNNVGSGALDSVLDVLEKLLLVGLQKEHEEYRCDFDSQEQVKKTIDRIEDLLDDYFDEPDSMDYIDLMMALSKELEESNFLSKNLEKKEKEFPMNPPEN